MESTPTRLGRRPAFDGLRGIAVLLVVGVHLSLVAQGYIGVDIFLVLSGFLVTALLLEEHERTGQILLRRFCVRRARRLLPALAVLMAVFTALVLTINPYPSTWPLDRLLATTWTFANNWVITLAPEHGQALGALSPTWTLAQEVQFYVLWSAALVVALRFRVRPAGLLLALALAIGALVAGADYLRHASSVYNTYTSPLDRGGEMLLGCAAAVLWRQGWSPRLLRSTLCAWLAAAGLVFILLDTGLVQRWSYLATAALTACLLISLVSTPGARRRKSSSSAEGGQASSAAEGGQPSSAPDPLALSRWLAVRPLCYLGKISYGVYLYHLPVYYLLWHFMPNRAHLFYAPIVLAATVALAATSWRIIEAPVNRRRPRPEGVSESRLARWRRWVPAPGAD